MRQKWTRILNPLFAERMADRSFDLPTNYGLYYMRLSNALRILEKKIDEDPYNTEFVKEGHRLIQKAFKVMNDYLQDPRQERTERKTSEMKDEILNFVDDYNTMKSRGEPPSKRRRAMSRSVSTPSCLIL